MQHVEHRITLRMVLRKGFAAAKDVGRSLEDNLQGAVRGIESERAIGEVYPLPGIFNAAALSNHHNFYLARVD